MRKICATLSVNSYVIKESVQHLEIIVKNKKKKECLNWTYMTNCWLLSEAIVP